MSPAPWGYYYRRDGSGLRGWLSRWWFERRSMRVREELRKRRQL